MVNFMLCVFYQVLYKYGEKLPLHFILPLLRATHV